MSGARVDAIERIDGSDAPRWRARVRLPGEDRLTEVLIVESAGKLLAFPARCPHEGVSLEGCALADGAVLVCPGHQQRVEALEQTHGCVVERSGDGFRIGRREPAGARAGRQPGNAQLQEEIEQLRLANETQQKQLGVITRSMDAMLAESERQKLEYKRMAEQERGLARFVDRVLDTMQELLILVDSDGRIVRTNRAAQHQLGGSEAELPGTMLDELLADTDRAALAASLPPLPWRVQSVLLEAIRAQGSYVGEHRLHTRAASRDEAYFRVSGSLLYSERGKLEGAVVSATDISDLKEREIRLRLGSTVFANSREGIYVCDEKGVIQEANDAFCEITGYAREDIVGRTVAFFESGLHDQAFYDDLRRQVLQTGSWRGEFWYRRKGGDPCPMLVSITAVENGEGQPVHFATVCTDISHLKEAEQQLQRLAYLDPLTGLPNRALFRDRMEHEIRLARRKGTRLAVLFLDLDHFKNINDSLGHAVGDHVLQVVASRLQDCVRSTDTVARLGGDEFTVILAGITEVQDATDIARKIVERLQAGIDIADHVYHVGASVGIAMHPDDGEDFDTLTRHADTAMYAAKAKGRGRFQYFEARMNEAAQQRLQLENALRAGIDRGEFELHFQPKADCFSGEIVGAEALVRWHRPEAGMVSPELFITIAEDTGLIVPLGAWILRTACLHACRWAPGRTGFRLSVNLSPRQLLDEGFPELLDRVLAETGVDPGWIELEVTEGVVMHDLARARACMDAVRARGIRLAMDDFGTGYSSLSYLQKLPIQSLKIDRSFVQAFGGDRSSSEAAFIRTIVALGHSLDLGVVAEGIETEAQLALLQSCGCDAYQGYHLSRPVPAPEFEQRWLHRDAATRADAH